MFGNKAVINDKSMTSLVVFLYFVGMNVLQLGKGFDGVFVRVSFVVLIIVLISKAGVLRFTEQAVWSIAFWGFYFLSMLWAQNTEDPLYYIPNFVQIVGLSVFLPVILKTEDDIEHVFKLFLLSMALMMIRLYILTPDRTWGSERVGRDIGMNPNTLGLRLVLTGILAVHFLHNVFKKGDKSRYKLIRAAFYISILAASVVISLFTGSKKAIGGILLGVLIYEAVKARGFMFVIKIALIVFAVILIYQIIMTNEMIHDILGTRIEKFVNTYTGTDYFGREVKADTSYLERQWYKVQARKLFFEHPILGYGANGFVTRMKEIHYHHVAYCHHNYWELLATLGVVGFTIYYSMWFKTAFALMKKSFTERQPLYILCFALIITVLMLDTSNVSYITDTVQLMLILSCNLINNKPFRLRNRKT